jgi:CDP-diacylglycerol--glycerol-3-phosphate 3-phosphatidyltransferase
MNLPNILTFSRLPFLLLFILLDVLGAYWASFVIILLAGLSDVLDGHFARKAKPTAHGVFYDQFVDKIFVVIALIFFLDKGYISFILVALIVFRELFVTLLRQVYKKRKHISPLISGKIKMVAEIVLVASLSFGNIFEIFIPISSWIALLVIVLAYYSLARMWWNLARP